MVADGVPESTDGVDDGVGTGGGVVSAGCGDREGVTGEGSTGEAVQSKEGVIIN